MSAQNPFSTDSTPYSDGLPIPPGTIPPTTEVGFSGSGPAGVPFQNPFFTYCTTYPGGSPIPPGTSTPSSGVEFGGSGPAGVPFVITDNGVMVSSGVFNQSGALLQQLMNLSQGPHRFELRENASLPATDIWTLTVAPVAPVRNEDFNNVPIAIYPQLLTTPGLKIAVTSGAHGVGVYAAPANEVPLLPGKIDGRAAVLLTNGGATGVFRCDLSVPTNTIAFYYSRVLFSGGSVVFYDRLQNMIQTLPLQVTGPYDSPIAHPMVFNARNISRCDIITPRNNAIVVDNFTF